ncbi:hypothetical protein H3V53_17530 [Paraburkholderia bengalensis]|uniref:Uncharacterized protein n=1 Tax=Paraburkholderia bengalensis TaxID=2747562 RepID=A0ABU8IU20_9BURK
MRASKPFDRTREMTCQNARLHRIAATAVQDARNLVGDMQLISTLVSALLRPESKNYRASLLEALAHMTSVCLIHATLDKEYIEIACSGSQATTMQGQQCNVAITIDGTTARR